MYIYVHIQTYIYICIRCYLNINMGTLCWQLFRRPTVPLRHAIDPVKAASECKLPAAQPQWLSYCQCHDQNLAATQVELEVSGAALDIMSPISPKALLSFNV